MNGQDWLKNRFKIAASCHLDPMNFNQTHAYNCIFVKSVELAHGGILKAPPANPWTYIYR